MRSWVLESWLLENCSQKALLSAGCLACAAASMLLESKSGKCNMTSACYTNDAQLPLVMKYQPPSQHMSGVTNQHNGGAGIMELSVAMVEQRRRQQEQASSAPPMPSLPEPTPAVAHTYSQVPSVPMSVHLFGCLSLK